MDAGQFAEFWERQGRRVIETNSCFWFNSQPLSFASIPYHRVVDPSRRDLAEVFFRGPAFALRFLAEPAENGQAGGLFVCSKDSYGLSSLQKKARNQTRRGLDHCRVERAEFSDLAQRGHKLNVGTFLRQGRGPATMTEAQAGPLLHRGDHKTATSKRGSHGLTGSGRHCWLPLSWKTFSRSFIKARPGTTSPTTPTTRWCLK